ncbi:hypothetical protein ACGFX4_16255 [Kitasatospora sp. NPDC048365]|uniref:hypothetical protein n=1 Tax=Kitasatospora sp. NPDC048365 TaxID=3364050 RepID=UPI0037248E16
MNVSELVRAELARHDWTALTCACLDSAEHLPLVFETLLTAESPQDARGYALSGHVEYSGIIAECTGPAIGVILAALAGEVSPAVRSEFLETLACAAYGSGYDTAPPAARANDEFRAMVREGFWLLMQAGLTGSAQDAEAVADLCEYYDLGDQKSAYYLLLLRERVRAKSKRRVARR